MEVDCLLPVRLAWEDEEDTCPYCFEEGMRRWIDLASAEEGRLCENCGAIE